MWGPRVDLVGRRFFKEIIGVFFLRFFVVFFLYGFYRFFFFTGVAGFRPVFFLKEF